MRRALVVMAAAAAVCMLLLAVASPVAGEAAGADATLTTEAGRHTMAKATEEEKALLQVLDAMQAHAAAQTDEQQPASLLEAETRAEAAADAETEVEVDRKHKKKHGKKHHKKRMPFPEVPSQPVHADCPRKARRQVRMCKRLLKTMKQEGRIRARPGQGEEICSIARFAYEDMRVCAAVYDHIADVGTGAWDLNDRVRGVSSTTFCVQVLAHPINSRALISPRTERKCLGEQTCFDKKSDREGELPAGYTGNILEDYIGDDVYYRNNCRCFCKMGEKLSDNCCSSCRNKKNKPRKAPKKRHHPSRLHKLKPRRKHRKPVPPKPLPPRTQTCKKGSFPYEFPYTRYLKKKTSVHVVADFEMQRMRVYKGERVLKEYAMSSSEVGIGSASGSLKSPSGKFRISQLVGAKAKSGQDISNHRIISKRSGPNDKAAIQSRVLVLAGEDKNNKNTHSRRIYIHGTNKKASLGHPASQGHFRLSNADVIDLFKRVKVGTRFFAIPKCAFKKHPRSKKAKKHRKNKHAKKHSKKHHGKHPKQQKRGKELAKKALAMLKGKKHGHGPKHHGLKAQDITPLDKNGKSRSFYKHGGGPSKALNFYKHGGGPSDLLRSLVPKKVLNMAHKALHSDQGKPSPLLRNLVPKNLLNLANKEMHAGRGRPSPLMNKIGQMAQKAAHRAPPPQRGGRRGRFGKRR